MSTPDAVIIGSGFGALTCAAHLARAGMKVRVLEQHLRIGGYAHRFKRGAFEFDSGIHSVPMAPGGIIDGILSGLGVRGRIGAFVLANLALLLLFAPWLSALFGQLSTDASYWEGEFKLDEAMRHVANRFTSG